LSDLFTGDHTTGWLAYCGQFIPCDAWHHDRWARKVIGVDENELEMRGWVKIWGVTQDPQFSNEQHLSHWQRDWLDRHGIDTENYE